MKNVGKHKHVVTMTFEVLAEGWEQAAETVLRTGFQHLADCNVRRQHGRRTTINVAALQRAAEQLAKEAADGQTDRTTGQ